jgi:hypothetical protein
MADDRRPTRAGQPGSTRHEHEPWTEDDLQKLRELARTDTPVRVIGLTLGRSDAAVRSRAKVEGISLASYPNVQRPVPEHRTRPRMTARAVRRGALTPPSVLRREFAR